MRSSATPPPIYVTLPRTDIDAVNKLMYSDRVHDILYRSMDSIQYFKWMLLVHPLCDRLCFIWFLAGEKTETECDNIRWH